MGYSIRVFGDPVLKTKAAPSPRSTARSHGSSTTCSTSLYTSDSGIGLAAPQIGVQKQIFVWDMDDQPMVVINPEIVESSGEWVYDEGCLSIPGLYVEMLRPNQVLMRGLDLDGNTVEIEADELAGRLFQHELDHLNGVLMFDRMTPEQRKEAMAEYRRILEAPSSDAGTVASTEAEVTDAPRRPQRLVYLGTPALAVPPLEALVAAGFDVGARRHPHRQAARPRQRADAEPGQGGGAASRAAGRRIASTTCSASVPSSASSSRSGS